MGFRPDESRPLPQVGLRRLPCLDQPEGDHPSEGSDTRAFRAALRGLASNQDTEMASRVTAPLPGARLALRNTPGAAKRARRGTRRRLMLIMATLLAALGVGVPLLGAHFGALAFGLNINQPTAAPIPKQSVVAQAGVMEASAPATPTATPKPPPPPPTPAPKPPTPAPKPPTPAPTPRPPAPQPTQPPPSSTPTGPYSNSTPPPGYTSFAVQDFAGDPWAGSFGQCTWWAQHKRLDENFRGWGDAWNWANAARAQGYTVTSTPAPNATVVFAPGVQGASNLGHVSHVEKILTGGWVLVSEMNFYWNGGGFARVDYRYIHVGTGVWFIH